VEYLVDWLAGETEVLGENLPQCTLSTTNPIRSDSSLNPSHRGGKPATNQLPPFLPFFFKQEVSETEFCLSVTLLKGPWCVRTYSMTSWHSDN
jgi:hypothetical protein